MEQPTFRRARKEDCATIAALYSISSDGVADYIWTKLAKPGQDILDVGRQRYEREGTAFSYQNRTIVESEGEIIGMLVAFPMHVDPSEQESDPVLAPYSKLGEDNSYYIYREVARERVYPHPLIHYTGDAVLMVKEIE